MATTIKLMNKEIVGLAIRHPEQFFKWVFPHTAIGKFWEKLNRPRYIYLTNRWLWYKLADLHSWLYRKCDTVERGHHHVYDPHYDDIIDTLGCSWSRTLFTKDYSEELYSEYAIFPLTTKFNLRIILFDGFEKSITIKW